MRSDSRSSGKPGLPRPEPGRPRERRYSPQPPVSSSRSPPGDVPDTTSQLSTASQGASHKPRQQPRRNGRLPTVVLDWRRSITDRHSGSATSAITRVDATSLLCQCVAVAVVREKHMADTSTDKPVVSLVRNVCQPITAELEETIVFVDGTASDALAKVLTRSAEVVRTAATE